MRINVRPPIINESSAGFTPNAAKRSIFYGIGAVKGVGDAATTKIIDERKQNGPYADFDDFVDRVLLDPDARVTSGDVGSLIRVGAFDDMGERSELLSRLETLVPWAAKVRDYQRGKTNQESGDAWGSHRKSMPEKPPASITPIMEMAFEEKLRFEMELLGQFISGHPMDGFESVLPMIGRRTGAKPNVKDDIFQLGYKRLSSIVGYVLAVEQKKIKSGKNTGKAFFVVRLLANNEVVEAVAWPETVERYRFLLAPDERLWLIVNYRGRSASIEAVIDLKEVIVDWTQGFSLVLNDDVDLRDIDDAIGQSEGDKWSAFRMGETTYAGPPVRLSPNKLRKIADLGDVTLF